MHKTWHELLPLIVGMVRTLARSIERFAKTKQGGIRICAYPCCKEADEWLSGCNLGCFDDGEEDIIDYEYTLPILPGGDRVAKFEEDDKTSSYNTYAITAMKIADCSRAQHLGLPAFSGIPHKARQEDDPKHGYANWRGAVCVNVSKLNENGKLSKFCGIYISVSGASDGEDFECAMHAVPTIQEFFETEEDHFEVSIHALATT